MLETELGRTKSSEKTAKEGLSRVSKTAEEQASSLTQLSQLNKSLQGERDDTARRLQNLTAELSSQQSAKEEIQIALKANDKALKRKEKECKDLKDALNELSRAATLEQEQLEDRMNHVILTGNDLRSTLRNTESQLDDAKESLRALQVEYETARADAEGMLKVMNGMEKQRTGCLILLGRRQRRVVRLMWVVHWILLVLLGMMGFDRQLMVVVRRDVQMPIVLDITCFV